MTLKWNVLADTAATDVAIAASACRSIANTFMPLSMKMNCLINWMTGINRLNIFVNYSDRILPHVPTWRRNWSWFRCEPALFYFCSRSPGSIFGETLCIFVCSRLAGGIFWRKGTAVGWRQETPSANESVVSPTTFRKILAFFWKKRSLPDIVQNFDIPQPFSAGISKNTEHRRSLCNVISREIGALPFIFRLLAAVKRRKMILERLQWRCDFGGLRHSGFHWHFAHFLAF